ncbi:extracellular catalytic domain type 1 short-chain-length polyhydroxyalkanoate depolymerase [Longitalea arenae]|uniref:extracellular catalytic domain type 1 short-chain-length polyhydroxyalkanoate depolymerase n=1 Tax=Longitalea arenae TaxID=2812558 RepID=UPI0019686EEA|nr:PHB depolymerase family esterase [Longitalea arenae]
MKTIVDIIAGISLFWMATGCGKDTAPPPRHFQASITVNGLHRSYIVNLPPAYYSDTIRAYPMVIALHGTGGSASQFERDYEFSEKADASGFVAVYPNGVASNGVLHLRSWNAGSCCDFAMKNGIDDVSFISQLIDKMTRTYLIDPKRVYVTGMSNGGMMTYRLAAELSNKIAAIAPVSASMVYTAPAHQPGPMPILHLHSALDRIVPYYGGSNALGYYFPPIDSVLNGWAIRNNCLPNARVVVDNAQYKQLEWTNAQGNVLISHYVTQDGGHAWPGGKQVRSRADIPSQVINANDLIWSFFQRFKLE